MNTIIQAFKTVFSSKKYMFFDAIVFLVFLTLYLFVLPATYTGGRIGLISLKFLTLKMSIFAIIFAILLSLTLSFTVFSYHKGKEGGRSATTGGFLVSIITPFLCCTPILPIIFSFLGGFIPFLSASKGNIIQAFIAMHETEIFIGVALLMLFALYQNSKAIIRHPACKY